MSIASQILNEAAVIEHSYFLSEQERALIHQLVHADFRLSKDQLSLIPGLIDKFSPPEIEPVQFDDDEQVVDYEDWYEGERK